MDIQEMITDLQELGMSLTVDGDRLQIDAPKGIITPAIRAELVRHKAELLAVLGAVEPDSAPADRIPLLPWAAELPIPIEDWPDFKARHGRLPGVQLTWPASSPGLVAECQQGVVQ